MLNLLQGYYTPSPFSNATVYPTKNVTSCSNQTALFTFDPTAILQQELGPNHKLSDLKWPSQVQDAVAAIQTATRAMFICYCIGIAFAGLAIIGAIFGLLSGGRLSDSLNAVIDLVSFLFRLERVCIRRLTGFASWHSLPLASLLASRRLSL